MTDRTGVSHPVARARPEHSTPVADQGAGALTPRSPVQPSPSAMLAVCQVRWDDIADTIEPALPKADGRNWYAPATTASMIRSYFMRRWFHLTADEMSSLLHAEAGPARVDARQVRRFDFVFEHYQLKEIVAPQVERQMRDWTIATG